MPFSNAVRVLAAGLATLLASAAFAQQCPAHGQYKALELYSWRDSKGWVLAVVPGTERAKTEAEVKSSPCRSPVSDPFAAFGAGPPQEVFWFHRGMPGFRYPPVALIDEIARVAAVRELRLIGPPENEPPKIADAASCRQWEAPLARQRTEHEAMVASVRAEMLDKIRNAPGDPEARERELAAWRRNVNAVLIRWNLEAGKLLAACSHRTHLRADLPMLAPVGEPYRSVTTSLLTEAQSAELTKRALAGEAAVLLRQNVDRGKVDAIVAVHNSGKLLGDGVMGRDLRARHIAIVDRAIGRQQRVASKSSGGDAVVETFYGIVDEPQGRVMEVVIFVYKPKPVGPGRPAHEDIDVVLWAGIARARVAEDPIATYARLVDTAFESFLQPPR